MKEYQKIWLQTLRDAWDSPDKNFMLWQVTNEIISDDSGKTDALTQELAKWLDEALN